MAFNPDAISKSGSEISSSGKPEKKVRFRIVSREDLDKQPHHDPEDLSADETTQEIARLLQEEERVADVDTTNVMNPFRLGIKKRREIEREMHTPMKEDAQTEEGVKASTVSFGEQEKIYPRPSDDPAVQKIEDGILTASNENIEVREASRTKGIHGHDGVIALSNAFFNKESKQQWEKFVIDHPQKAEVYAQMGHEGIKSALIWNKRVSSGEEFYIGESDKHTYKDPQEDPDVVAVESSIKRAVNISPEIKKAIQLSHSAEVFRDTWNDVKGREEYRQWKKFVDTYPEKARIYAEMGHEGIVHALSTQETIDLGEILTPEIVEKDLKDFFDGDLAVADESVQLDNKEKRPERGQKPEPVVVSNRFEQEFNITHEELADIEGFSELSRGQQSLVFENFSQLTRGNVQEESVRLYNESIYAQQALRRSKIATFLGGTKNTGAFRTRMVNMLSATLGGVISKFQGTFTEEYKKAQFMKDERERVKNGGIEEHQELLGQLVESLLKNGPRVHESPTGELIIDLVNIRERATEKDVRDAEWFAMSKLNTVADQFARIPAEWRGRTLGVDGKENSGTMKIIKEKFLRSKHFKNQKMYEDAERAYTNAKEEFEGILRAKGKNNLEIAQTLVGIDSRVYQLQTLRTNPDVLEELQKTNDTNPRDEFMKGLSEKMKLKYFGLGFVGRSLIGESFARSILPPATLIWGAVSSWNRSAAEMRERDRMARKGIKDTKDGALNIVSADDLTQKLTSLTERCLSTKGKSKEKLLASLRARIEYTRDKQILQRIEYGDRRNFITNQTRLIEALGGALAYLATESLAQTDVVDTSSTHIGARLTRRLARTEDTITATRYSKRRLDLMKDTAKRSLALIVGVSVAEYVLEHVIDTSDSTVTDSLQESPAVTIEDTPEAPIENQAPILSEKVVVSKPYVVEAGDTLTAIIKNQIPEITKLSGTFAQENAIANILNSLTVDDITTIGIQSGDADVIQSGEAINIGRLQEIIETRSDIIQKAVARFGTK